MTRKTTATVRFKTMACRDCGMQMQVGSNTRKAPRCVECGVKEFQDNARDLAKRNGPGFERWLAGCAKAAIAGSMTTGVPVE